MTAISIEKDLAALTMTVTAEFPAPVERVWQMWQDPRLLERWWGPPTYPATFVHHDLTPGGSAAYFMTGPEGDKHHGWWRIVSVEAPRSLVLEDGFADDAGNPNTGLPTTTTQVELVELAGPPLPRTRMAIQTTFPSIEAMQELAAMGMEEGMRAAVGQIEGLLPQDPP